MAYQKRGYPKTRPWMWASGPDPDTHAQYRAWVQQRNQAVWRGETWTITFDQFQEIWLGRWHLRGRGTEDLAMTRTDWTGPWTQASVALRTRQQLGQQQAEARARGHRSRARERELARTAAATGATHVAVPVSASAAQENRVATGGHWITADAKDSKGSVAPSNYRAGGQENSDG